MNEIYIHDSLSNQKKKFEPIDSNNIRMYACGPTVYNYAHIGNARMAIVFDTFARLLRSKYPNVTYVSNITDIDDNIIEAAHEQKVEISSITEGMGASIADLGARISTVSNQREILEDTNLRYQDLLSNAQDLDYATAVTKLSAELLSLEAAQASFAKISQLSLFNYIR